MSWADVKRTVYVRDGGVCQLCGRLVAPRAYVADHIRPQAAGGGSALDNLQLAHGRCNNLKAPADRALARQMAPRYGNLAVNLGLDAQGFRRPEYADLA